MIPYSLLLLLLALANIFSPSSARPADLSKFDDQKGDTAFQFDLLPPQIVNVNPSTLSWGTRKALSYSLRDEAPDHVPIFANKGLASLFKDLQTFPNGSTLTHKLLHEIGGLDIDHRIPTEIMKAFLATFDSYGINHARTQSWVGQQRMPGIANTLQTRAGGSELVIQSGQIIAVPAGSRIRTELHATFQTWASGTIAQCTGGCWHFMDHEAPATWMQLKDGDTKPLPIGPATEFLELYFPDPMRIVIVTDRSYLLRLPSNAAYEIGKNGFVPSERINGAAWKSLPPVSKVMDWRTVCQKAREYEGEPQGWDEGACEVPTILEFQELAHPGEASLPLRPLTTVWDFADELVKFQKRVELCKGSLEVCGASLS